MKFIKVTRLNGNVLQMKDDTLGIEGSAVEMDEHEIREFLAWLNRNMPMVVRDVLCENCPEVR